MNLYRIALISLILLSFTAGCKGKRSLVDTYPIEGTVTLDGVPLTKVAVLFEPTESGTNEVATGSVDENGKLTVSTPNGLPGKGAMEGEYAVTFIKTTIKTVSRPVFDPGTGGMTNQIAVNIIPKIYQTKETTPFTVTVKKGKNVFDFPLKSK